MGYRYYDKKKMDVLFPFGHGLSYTTFEYSGLRLSAERIRDTDTLTVTCTVKNTGSRAGKAVAQLYVGDVESDALRPARELKGFEKVELAPGEAKDVSFTLDKRAFAYWNTDIHDWHVESGAFTIEIGASSRDLPLKGVVNVESTVRLPARYDVNSIFLDIMKDPKAKAALQPLIDGFMKAFAPPEDQSEAAGEAISAEMSMAMINYMPLRGLLSFGGDQIPAGMIEGLLEQLNQG